VLGTVTGDEDPHDEVEALQGRGQTRALYQPTIQATRASPLRAVPPDVSICDAELLPRTQLTARRYFLVEAR
jgi:hypothetical protein